TLSGGPSGAALVGGSTNVAPVNGIATFSGLTIDSAGTGYQLPATVPGITSAATSTFNVVAGAASQLGFIPAGQTSLTGGQISVTLGQGSNGATGSVSSPVLTGVAGQTLGAIKVVVGDQFGNGVTSGNVTIALG